jgi:DNA repair protein SbcC/Rad50
MQISSIGLRNLRSYRSARLSLESGTTLLTGDIGSGKTSLLYAIELALFGFAEVDAGYLIRHGAREAEVSLALRDGTRVVEFRRAYVRRSRKGRATFEPAENSLTVDGQRTSYSATELRRRAIELLGFPDNPNPRAHSDVWRWAVYLAQERMRDVLDPDAETRMETVRKALGVEQYRLAGENARGLARTLRERAASLEEQSARHRGVEGEMARWNLEELAARQHLAAMDARDRDLREELARARGALDSAEVDYREFQLAQEAVAHQERLWEELNGSIEQDQAGAQAARDHLARLEADRTLEAAEAPSKEPASALAPLRARREQLLRELTELEEARGQASGVEEQLAQSLARVDELAARHSSTLQQLAKARSELLQLSTTDPMNEPTPADDRTPADLVRERNTLEEARRSTDRRLTVAATELKELAELVQEGVCPRCHRPVQASEFASHREEQELLVGQLQGELDSASRAVRSADDRMLARAEFDRLHDRWEQLEERRADLRQREATLRAASLTDEGLVQQLEEERGVLEKRRRTLSGRLELLDRVRGEISAVDRELSEAEERSRSAAVRRERLGAIDRQIPEIEAEIQRRTQSLANRTNRAQEVRQAIEAARTRLAESSDVHGRRHSARARVEQLGEALEISMREAGGPRGKLSEASARLEELGRRLQERRQLEEDASRLRALAEWIEEPFRTAMAGLEQRRLAQGRFQFARRFGQYFAALVEDPDLSARVDETFAPWVDLGGTATPPEALSGGERTALALAYRLALGRTVRDAGRMTLETLILDEPTEGFSQEQTLRMGDLLEGLGLPQVILVSHERQLEGIADRVVRISKKHGVSSVEGAGPAGLSGTAADPLSGEAPSSQPVPARRRKTRRITDLDGVETGPGPAHAR